MSIEFSENIMEIIHFHQHLSGPRSWSFDIHDIGGYVSRLVVDNGLVFPYNIHSVDFAFFTRGKNV